MARFTIDSETNYYLSLYITGEHDATTWIVSKDVGFTKIIDKVERSADALLEWVTPLPKLPEDKTGTDAEYYKNLEELYLRVAIHSGDSVSPFVTLGPLRQGDQEVLITKGDETIERTTAEKLGWLKTTI